MAGWDENYFLYLPNITKIIFSCIVMMYLFIRGILLPLNKGTNFKFVVFFNFILISILCFFLDIAKSIGFAHYKIINFFQKN